MPISFVGANSAAGTSVTVPAHVAGDLLIVTATRFSSTPPTVPTGSGWTTVLTRGTSNAAIAIGYIIATGSGTTSATWTNAGTTSVAVYRGVDGTTPIGGSASAVNPASINNQVVFPAITLQKTDNTSWVYRASSVYNGDVSAPPGFTQRSSQAASSNNRGRVFDTSGTVSSMASHTVSNTSFSWYTSATVELRAEPASSGTNYNETANAFAANVTTTAAGSKGSSATAPLGTSVSTSSTGTAQASATGSLITSAQVAATGSVAAAIGTPGLDTRVATSTTGSASAVTSANTLESEVTTTSTGVKGTSAAADDLSVDVTTSSTGTVSANASADLDVEVSTTASGAASASATAEFSTEVSLGPVTSGTAQEATATLQALLDLDATGGIQTQASASLDAVASLDSEGTASANATAEFDAVTEFEASGSADTYTDTEFAVETLMGPATSGTAQEATATLQTLLGLDEAAGTRGVYATGSLNTEVSYISTGSAATSTDASFDTEVAYTATGSAAASSTADALSLTAATDALGGFSTFSAANLFEVAALFSEVESSLSANSDSEFSLTVDFEASGGAGFSDEASFPVTLNLGPVDADGGGEATAEFSIRVAFEDSDSSLDTSGTVNDFETLVILEDADSDLSYGASASLSVNAGFGSVTARRSVDWSIYISMSAVVTEIPTTLVTTVVPDLSILTDMPSTGITTQIPFDVVATVIDDPEIRTDIDSFDVETQLPSTIIRTSIPTPGVTTTLEG